LKKEESYVLIAGHIFCYRSNVSDMYKLIDKIVL